MDQSSPVISQQIFGSSKKIQFIGIPTHDNRRAVRRALDEQDRSSAAQQPMSIESLLDTNGDSRFKKQNTSISALLADTERESHKRHWTNDGVVERSAKQRRFTKDTPARLFPVQHDMTTITCLHASVAQKSYGTEKRFLCPPPLVMMRGTQHGERPQVSMAVVGENGDLSVEQHSFLDEQLYSTFKYLHVTGTAKAKQFCLRVSLSSSDSSSGAANKEVSPSPYATFLSNPIAIISKPSKKTSKARNVSTCILANAPIALFNRINSQTVRTKYMTSEGSRLCAKSSTWSPFDIIIMHNPNSLALPTARTGHHPGPATPVPIHYGTEIVLRDSRTGITSPPLLIRKVDRGRITPCAFGPVSQMQKIALQLASSAKGQPVYLCAAGNLAEASSDRHDSGNTSSWLDFSPSRVVQPTKHSMELAYEQVDDYLCWTIVGIAKFECSFFRQDTTNTAHPDEPVSPPPSPPSTHFPILSSILYRPETHTLDVIGQHLVQAANASPLVSCYLGTHGPLNTRLVSIQSEQPGSTRQSHHLTIELPNTQDLLATDHDRLVDHHNGDRSLQLPLLFSRKDGLVYHSGKLLACDILANCDARWSVVSASQSQSSLT